MSYSFQAKGTTKAEAIAAVAAKLAEVVAQQPVHAADKDQALAAATAFINLLPDDGEKDVSVSVGGSLGWNDLPAEQNITSAQVSTYASLVKREEQAPQAT